MDKLLRPIDTKPTLKPFYVALGVAVGLILLLGWLVWDLYAAAGAQAADKEWRQALLLFVGLLATVTVAALFYYLRHWQWMDERRRLTELNRSMEEGRRLLQTVIDASDDAIFVKDRRCRYVFCNQRLEEILGQTLSQLRAASIPSEAEANDDAAHPDGLQWDRQVMATGERCVTEEKRMVGGKMRTFQTDRIPWFRGGRVVGIIGIARDVTYQRRREAGLEKRVAQRTQALTAALANLQQEMAEREAAEDKMKHMQRIEALGQLTGGIAHDFNNMLAIIRGALNRARKRLQFVPDTQLAKALDNADDGVSRAADLASRLLTFASKRPLQPKPWEVNALIHRTTQLLAQTLGGAITIEVRPCPQGGWIAVDEVQFENALVNLALNARDAMPHGGTLIIAAQRRDDRIHIIVQDDGDGMDDHIKQSVFEPFFTTKDTGKGTGLGLSQVHGFMAQSGGRVEIDSAKGKGTTVFLEIPAIAAPAPLQESKPAQSLCVPVADAKNDRTILVVDDEPLILQSAQDMLLSLGYRCLLAANGAEALSALARHDDIAVMLTDIHMPHMHGRDLARLARAAHPHVHTVLVTGYGDETTATIGDIQILRKPYDEDELAAVVHAALHSDETTQGT